MMTRRTMLKNFAAAMGAVMLASAEANKNLSSKEPKASGAETRIENNNKAMKRAA